MKIARHIIFATSCLRLLPRELLLFTVSAQELCKSSNIQNTIQDSDWNKKMPNVKSKPVALHENDDPSYDDSTKCIMSFYPRAATDDGQAVSFPNHVCTDDQSSSSGQDPVVGVSLQMNLKHKEEGQVYKSIFSSVARLVYWFPLLFFSINLLSCIYDGKSGLDDDEI